MFSESRPAFFAAVFDHRPGELIGDRRGDTVDELMGLVDDEEVVLGKHLAPLERVDRHANEWFVTMTSTSLAAARPARRNTRPRRGTCRPGTPAPRRRPGAKPAPGRPARARPVTRLGLGRPGAQSDDLMSEPPGARVDRSDGEQPVILVREAALDLVDAHVVAPALDEGIGRARAEERLQWAVATRGMSRSTICACRASVAVATTAGSRSRRHAPPPARGRPGTCRSRCRPGRAGARRLDGVGHRSRHLHPAPAARLLRPPATAACRSWSSVGRGAIGSGYSARLPHRSIPSVTVENPPRSGQGAGWIGS